MRTHIALRPSQMLASVFAMIGAGAVLSSCASGRPPSEAPIQGVAEERVDLRPPRLAEAAKTQVLILATPHLRTLGDKFNPSLLASLLAALEAFEPGLVAVEQMPPHVIHAMLDRREEFAPVLDQFASHTVRLAQVAQEHLAVSPHAASEAAIELQDRLRNATDASDASRIRAQLVLQLLAAYDFPSAVLQWSYLSEAAPPNDSVIPQDVAAALAERLHASREDISVGVELAGRLGLERVEAIDDHADKDLFLQFAEQLVGELEGNPAFENTAAVPIYAESARRLEQALERADLLPYYLFLNSAEYGIADVDAQFHVFFRSQLPSGLDRARSAVWEVRNLNIASHIRRVTAMHPGTRALVIIGAGHKPFLDAYLGAMMDMKIVQLSDLVGEAQ